MSTPTTPNTELEELLEVLSGPAGWMADLEALITQAERRAELKGRVDELYSLITPIWGDKNWDEPDDYVLSLKGRNILNHIKDLEKQVRTLQENQANE